MYQRKLVKIFFTIFFLAMFAISQAQHQNQQESNHPGKNAFKPLTVELQHTITIDGAPEVVFPLLTPEGNRRWSSHAASLKLEWIFPKKNIHS